MQTLSDQMDALHKHGAALAPQDGLVDFLPGIEALATQRRVEVPVAFWQRCAKVLGDCQNADGSWSWSAQKGTPPSPAATAAAISCLLEMHTMIDPAPTPNQPVDQKIAAANAYLTRTFNPASHDYQYLYNLLRLTAEYGQPDIPGTDIRDQITAKLLHAQEPDGSWPIWNDPVLGPCDKTFATANALQALCAASRPLVLNKLRYEGQWNQHRLASRSCTTKINRITRKMSGIWWPR